MHQTFPSVVTFIFANRDSGGAGSRRVPLNHFVDYTSQADEVNKIANAAKRWLYVGCSNVAVYHFYRRTERLGKPPFSMRKICTKTSKKINW
jgi:hypothetical protein